jgi:hypothetical protein
VPEDGDSRPNPDPTRLTTAQLRETETVLNRNIDVAVAGLRELLTQRIDGMDKATELLAATVGKVPSDMDKATGALRDLLNARIDAMDTATKLLADGLHQFPSNVDRAVSGQKEVLLGEIFRVRDIMLEKFAAVDALFASNATALTAALAAQEKAVAAQNDSNTLAITKSEQATKETITANAAQTTTGLQGLSTTMDDLKSRIVRLEGLLQSARLATEDSRATGTFSQTAEANRMAQSRATLQLAVAVISALIAVAAIIALVLKK